MVIRGDWKLVANGCREASWSDEHFGANSLTTTLRRGLLLSGDSSDVKDTRPPISIIIWYAEKCTRVLL